MRQQKAYREEHEFYKKKKKKTMTGKVQTRKYSSYENDTTGNSQNCYDTTEKTKQEWHRFID